MTSAPLSWEIGLVDSFYRNALLVLFGSAMLLGLGIIGLIGTDIESMPGFRRLASGWAPYWLAISGLAGMSAVLVALMRGQPEELRKEAAEEEARKAKKEIEAAEEAPLLADATLAIVEVEALIRGRKGRQTPMLGADVPPAALCRSILGARSQWMTSGSRKSLFDGLAGGRAAWDETKNQNLASVPVRGRPDGEAASYRFSALVHVPPTATLDSAAAILEILGRLPGDRFLEVAMARVPEEADTFAAATTVAGGLTVDTLSDLPEPGPEDEDEAETLEPSSTSALAATDSEVVDDSEVTEDSEVTPDSVPEAKDEMEVEADPAISKES